MKSDEKCKQIIFLPELAMKIGINEAIFLQYLHSCEKDSFNDQPELDCIEKTLAEWHSELYFWSFTTIRRIISKLENEDYIKTYNLPKSKLYRVNYLKISATELSDLRSTHMSGVTRSQNHVQCEHSQGKNHVQHEQRQGKKDVLCEQGRNKNRVLSGQGQQVYHVQREHGISASKNSSEALFNKENSVCIKGTEDKVMDNQILIQAQEIIKYLNLKAEKRFNENNIENLELIYERLSEGYTVEDFQAVVDYKTQQWLNDPKFRIYLRPATLFKAEKFDNYLNEAPRKNSRQSQGKFMYTPTVLNFSQGEDEL